MSNASILFVKGLNVKVEKFKTEKFKYEITNLIIQNHSDSKWQVEAFLIIIGLTDIDDK